LMVCMSVFFVPAVRRHALRTGGTPINSLARQDCFRLIGF
jgi:hypothetical protein